MPAVDPRPRILDVTYRPGAAYNVALTGPAGWLADLEFTATLAGTALTVNEDDDRLVLAVPSALTAAHPASGPAIPFVLTQVDGNDVLIGTWTPSLKGAPSGSTLEFDVVLAGPEVEVELLVGPAAGAGVGSIVPGHAIDVDASDPGDPTVSVDEAELQVTADLAIEIAARIAADAAAAAAVAADYVPKAGTYATAGTVLVESFVTGDTTSRFRARADGFLAWGPGNAARDTNLYRLADSILRTDDAFEAGLNVSAQRSLTAQSVIGAVGPGSEAGLALGSAGDAVLYRSAADTLRTADAFLVDGQFAVGRSTVGTAQADIWSTDAAREALLVRGAVSQTAVLQRWRDGAGASVGSMAVDGEFSTSGGVVATRSATTSHAYRAFVTGDTVARLAATAAGVLSWGPGNAAADSTLQRTSAAGLRIDPALGLGVSPTAGQGLLQFPVSALASSGIYWGTDVNLYRINANILRTDDDFEAALGLAAGSNVTARRSSSAQVVIGNVGPASEAAMSLGSAGDAVLYRSAADQLRTPDSLTVDGSIVTGALTAIRSGVSDAALIARTTPDTVGRLVVRADGQMQWGPGTAGADTIMERQSAGNLLLTGSHRATLSVIARNGVSAQTSLGAFGPSSESAVQFGSAGDTVLYRVGSDHLRTDDAFSALGLIHAAQGLSVGGQITTPAANSSTGDRISLYHDATPVTYGIGIQSNRMVLYTSTAAVGGVVVRYSAASSPYSTGGADRVVIGPAGPSNEDGIKLGSAGDVNLYRENVNILRTDDAFYASADVVAVRGSATGQVLIGDNGPGSAAAVVFGSAQDSSIYRLSANVLATDDEFRFNLAAPALRFNDAAQWQTTVGAAGAAAALPATPTKYLKLLDESGATFVVPAYAAA